MKLKNNEKEEILDKVYSEWFTHGQWKVVSEFFKNNLILRGAELREEQIINIIDNFEMNDTRLSDGWNKCLDLIKQEIKKVKK